MRQIRIFLGQIVRVALVWLSQRLAEPRTIWDRDGGTPYLARWYLIGQPPKTDGLGNPVIGSQSAGRFQVYLHKFFRSDHDGELHNHPWQWSVAIVLAGGYREERRVGDEVETVDRLPFSINLIRSRDYHRVDLLEKDSWSLFIAGPYASTWYFWCRRRLARSHWRSFLDWKQGRALDAVWTPDSRAQEHGGDSAT